MIKFDDLLCGVLFVGNHVRKRIDSYHTPVVIQSGSGLSRFLYDFATEMKNEALKEAKRGAIKGFKKGGRWGLPSISGAKRGAEQGALRGAKRVLKRKATGILDNIHAKSRRKINDIFG